MDPLPLLRGVPQSTAGTENLVSGQGVPQGHSTIYYSAYAYSGLEMTEYMETDFQFPEENNSSHFEETINFLVKGNSAHSE